MPSGPTWTSWPGRCWTHWWGAGVIRDDAQVAELHATKGYGERPGLAVALRPLEG